MENSGEGKKELEPRMAEAGRFRKKMVLALLAFIGVFFAVVASLSLILPSTETLKGAPPSSDSAKKMSWIGYYLVYYAVRHGEKFPLKLSELYTSGMIKDAGAFDSKELPGKVSGADDIDRGVDFKYLIAGEESRISDDRIAVLEENREDGIVMYISKKEISFDFKRKDGGGK